MNLLRAAVVFLVGAGLLTLAALLTGCATTRVAEPYWAGREPDALRRDHYECMVDSLHASRAAPRVGVGVAVPVARGFAVGAGLPVNEDPGARVYAGCMSRRGNVLVIPQDWAEERNAYLQALCATQSSFGTPEQCVAEGKVTAVPAPPGYQPLVTE